MKKHIYTAIRIIITAGILAFIFWKLDIGKSIAIIRQSDLLMLFWAFTALIIEVIIIAYRWHQLLHAYGFDISFINTARIYMIAFFFNNFLPSMVGMDVVRGIYAAREKKNIPDIISTIFIERWVGFLGIIIYLSIVPFFFIAHIDLKYVLIVSITGITASLAVIISIWNERVFNLFTQLFSKITIFNLGEKINNLYSSMKTIKDHTGIFIWNLFLSVLIQISFIIANYFIVIAQNIEITIPQLLVYIPLIAIISLIPLTINGIGLREWAYITLFGTTAKEEAFSLSITFFILFTLVSLIGGILFIFDKKEIKTDIEEYKKPGTESKSQVQ
ncbi:MAG: lysylphosphatidylglycerol synthase transmembrane domain-containing protein [candidate division WOR-3 bacterium]|nr:lysylphosphatidylglycerol synthase transmembrane domain-containing protein [candidate division WOR-3 bacterium]